MARNVYAVVISYLIFIVFFALFLISTSICFQSENFKCFRVTLVYMGLFFCSCFVAAVLMGEGSDLSYAPPPPPKKKISLNFKRKDHMFLIYMWIFLSYYQ